MSLTTAGLTTPPLIYIFFPCNLCVSFWKEWLCHINPPLWTEPPIELVVPFSCAQLTVSLGCPWGQRCRCQWAPAGPRDCPGSCGLPRRLSDAEGVFWISMDTSSGICSFYTCASWPVRLQKGTSRCPTKLWLNTSPPAAMVNISSFLLNCSSLKALARTIPLPAPNPYLSLTVLTILYPPSDHKMVSTGVQTQVLAGNQNQREAGKITGSCRTFWLHREATKHSPAHRPACSTRRLRSKWRSCDWGLRA